METERLYYIRRQQHVLRCDSYENLRNQKAQGATDISNVGQRVILPSSFTCGACYMLQNYLEAMSLCKWFGYPDFFITLTCNPKWPEIKRFLKDTSLQPEDRPDILCRLFKIKLDAFIKDLRENQIFGKVQASNSFIDVYTIEFQKRGLLHSHICLFMHPENKLPTVELIDPIISAEIPDRIEDPELRRNDGRFVEKSGVRLDNRSVVPYNKYLLKRYQEHINIEWCNQGSSIKYLFKYINKGPDRATVAVVPTNNECENNDALDEIAEYYDCRYLSACEASRRIFKYDVHCIYPSVFRLPFHFPNQQQIVYGEDDDIDDVIDKPSVAASKLTSWMECNAIGSEARKLTYVEFPTKFVWILNGRFWKRRKVGKAIDRIHSVSPKLGPTSFDEIRTVNGETHSSFRDACYALGLLDDDNEYIDAIKEASHYGSEKILLRNNSTLKNFKNMPYPDVESVSSSNNRLITEELDYDIPVIKIDYDRMFLALTNE
ncbi:uncharacterized protein LOC111904734 [Lactuca sativa]|uniref:uncharacterized protein LOC111904734 n=1 Tax=Lactuca sativa TaxID=4236 RepID=UPI0022B077E7|nr:uncharacterized protein LOC111904734 [Lactuca sativa]